MTCLRHAYYDHDCWGITGITQNDVVFLVRYDEHIAVPKANFSERDQKHIDMVKRKIARLGAKRALFF